MAFKKNDEWGIIIQKQLELDSIRNEFERNRAKLAKDSYRQELDNLQKIKFQQKLEEKLQKAKEGTDLAEVVKLSLTKESQNQNKRLEVNQKIIEENIQLEKMMNQRKFTEKLTSEEEDLRMNKRERETIIENLSKQKAMRQRYEKDVDTDLKLSQYKQVLRKQEEVQEKERELQLVKQEQEKLIERDMQYRDYFSRLENMQNRKAEAFSKNVSPQLYEKEVNYYQWIDKAEESKRRADYMQEMQREKKKEEDRRVINETLRKQTINYLSKEMTKAIDEELLQRIDYSMKIDQEKNYRRKAQVLSYRDELLNQAAFDKEKRAAEFKLSDKEIQLNRKLFEKNKSSLQRGANEILQCFELAKGQRSPNVSPSCLNTTLQMDYPYPINDRISSRLQRNRNSIF